MANLKLRRSCEVSSIPELQVAWGYASGSKAQPSPHRKKENDYMKAAVLDHAVKHKAAVLREVVEKYPKFLNLNALDMNLPDFAAAVGTVMAAKSVERIVILR